MKLEGLVSRFVSLHTARYLDKIWHLIVSYFHTSIHAGRGVFNYSYQSRCSVVDTMRINLLIFPSINTYTFSGRFMNRSKWISQSFSLTQRRYCRCIYSRRCRILETYGRFVRGMWYMHSIESSRLLECHAFGGRVGVKLRSWYRQRLFCPFVTPHIHLWPFHSKT